MTGTAKGTVLALLMHAVSLHFMYYNFARPHMTLQKKDRNKPTPAMAAGVADHVWTI